MRHESRSLVSLITAIAAGAIASAPAWAQSMKDLAGTYTLVSSVTEQGGTKTETFGPNPKGMLVLDAGGRYVISFRRAELAKIATNNRTTGTADENKAVVASTLSHFGTYSVDGAAKTLVFKIEASSFPNWDGTSQSRAFTLTGDELKYITPAASGGGTATLVWRRAK
jgi:polyisoprenoid-binding protein YceI